MRMTGIEPAHRTILEPKSSASASSATSACYISITENAKRHISGLCKQPPNFRASPDFSTSPIQKIKQAYSLVSQ